MEPGEVDLDRCAEISACLAHFPPGNHAEVVARFGLRWAAWRQAAARWAAARDEEIAAGRADLSARFLRAFAATADRLERHRASLEAIGPLPHSFRLEPTDDGAAAPAPGQPAPAVEARQMLPGATPIGAPPYQPLPAGLPPVVRAPQHLVATAAPFAAPTAPSLPFTPGAPAQAYERAVAHAEAVQGPASRAPLPGGTALAPASAAPAAVPAGVPDLTLEQYTSLRVELHLFPDHGPAVLARYGARPETQAPLFAHWQARFTSDGALSMAFAQRYARYLTWVKESPGAFEGIARVLGARG